MFRECAFCKIFMGEQVWRVSWPRTYAVFYYSIASGFDSLLPRTFFVSLLFVCFKLFFAIDFIIMALNFRQSLRGTAEHVLAVM